jgi:hypothetical protein
MKSDRLGGWVRPPQHRPLPALLLVLTGATGVFDAASTLGADPPFDLVSDRADCGDVLAAGVLEDPFLVSLAGKMGQASPQPMVMTTSVALLRTPCGLMRDHPSVAKGMHALTAWTSG